MNTEKEFEKIYTQYFEQVYSYLYRKGLNAQISSELTQETFLRVYNHMNTFRNECPIICWIFKIAHNVYCSAIKKEKLQRNAINSVKSASITYNQEGSANFENVIIKKQDSELILQAILELPEMIRKCIFFHYYNELSNKEITQLLNISINTVKTHIQEGLKKLRQAGFNTRVLGEKEDAIILEN